MLWVPVNDSANEIQVAVEGAGSLRFPAGERFDVINTLGIELTSDLRGRDIGYLEPDRGQRDTGGEIWGWCGAAVLLRAGYLRSVGLFDEAFFLYYEDTDLSWRGRNAGWRYVSVPASVVRHAHAQSTGTASALFDYLNQRNRLLMVTRNGTWRQRGRAWASSAATSAAMPGARSPAAGQGSATPPGAHATVGPGRPGGRRSRAPRTPSAFLIRSLRTGLYLPIEGSWSLAPRLEAERDHHPYPAPRLDRRRGH